MQATLIENNGNDRIAYDSLLIENPETLSILKTKLSLSILKELSKNPACAMDVAKKLKQHEQKVYYHFRKLEKAGLIYSVSTERRYGAIAKIYSVVSPVIALKLFERGTKIKDSFTPEVSPDVLKFFSPFIEDGKLNAKIIIGDPAPHGKYDQCSTESAHISDFVLLIGRMIKDLSFPNYKLDTEIKSEEELKENLILIGNPKTNTIIDKFNGSLPISFNLDNNSILSLKTKNSYKDDRTGLIVKCQNPLNLKKFVLLISGIRTRGFRAATIALTKYLSTKFKDLSNDTNLAVVVQGLDRDGDMLIDDVKFLE